MIITYFQYTVYATINDDIYRVGFHHNAFFSTIWLHVHVWCSSLTQLDYMYGLSWIETNFDTFWQVLQKCFESKDIASLQKAITELPEEEARYHMKRCVDSGLWVPEANKGQETEGKEKGEDEGEGEEVYEEVEWRAPPSRSRLKSAAVTLTTKPKSLARLTCFSS